ncbi:hypothetical protein CCACVL1_04038 [Corchorus capsularis]|uniref:Uncharacterized protein n=1 Tax=Corchorus capsularis TaxID=210143 RepID=A0A1R3JVD9_COCAP|nr:hypothetical protein CCACVL1_04038 [Corchorus capsularis]
MATNIKPSPPMDPSKPGPDPTKRESLVAAREQTIGYGLSNEELRISALVELTRQDRPKTCGNLVTRLGKLVQQANSETGGLLGE